MKQLTLILLMACSLLGCATSPGRLSLDFSLATPERVEQATNLVAQRLDGLVPIERADIAIMACGAVGAGAYYSLPDTATREERLAAGIDAANRHGREYYRDVLGERSLLDFAAERLQLSNAISDAEKWIGLLRYFLFNLDDVRSRVPKEAL